MKACFPMDCVEQGTNANQPKTQDRNLEKKDESTGKEANRCLSFHAIIILRKRRIFFKNFVLAHAF
jgi:hypothetical protein